MRRSELSASDKRGSSEVLGVAVLIGMTVMVTAGLGMGVLIMGQQQQQQTAQVDFTFLGDQLVVIYDDSTDRQAGRLYVDGPENNASWAELSDSKKPGDMVTTKDTVRLGKNTPYGAKPSEDRRYDLVYFTEDGTRYVLASHNGGQEGNSGGPSGGPDTPTPGG